MYTIRDRSTISSRNYGEETSVENIKGKEDTKTDSELNFSDLSHHFDHQDKNKGIMDCGTHRFEIGGSNLSDKLVSEIHEEFLTCKICLDQFKSPKSLQCLHTFCEDCIENHVASESTYKKYSDYREFTCPLCRKRTPLPIGGVKKLPDNFLVQSLGEVIGKQKTSKYPFCDICKMVSHKHKEAASKCIDCVKLLCKDCVTTHKETKVTSNHNIFDVGIEKDIQCKEHPEEVVRFYCESCDTCICVLCTFNEHANHEIKQFNEAVPKYRKNIQDMLSKCKGKIDKFDTQLICLNKAETIIKDTEQQIHSMSLKFISDIKNAEKQAIDEMHTLYGKDLLQQIQNKKELSITVENLRSTCSLTEVILKGKDMELLLLKKDVQKKLSLLSDIVIRTLPPTVSKVIKYLPGEIDFGGLQDMDNPFVSKMNTKMKSLNGQSKENISQITRPEVASKETQTNIEKGEDASIKDNKTKSSKKDDDSDEDSEEDDEDDEDDEKEKKSESEEESEEESSDDEDEKKKSLVDTGIQTEQINAESSSESEEEEEEEKKEMKDESTETDEVSTEEKAVDTRSRNHSNQRLSSSYDSSDDNSMSTQRRLRRERQNSNIYGSQMNADISNSIDYNTNRQQNVHSPDNNVDVFWDADGNLC